MSSPITLPFLLGSTFWTTVREQDPRWSTIVLLTHLREVSKAYQNGGCNAEKELSDLGVPISLLLKNKETKLQIHRVQLHEARQRKTRDL